MSWNRRHREPDGRSLTCLPASHLPLSPRIRQDTRIAPRFRAAARRRRAGRGGGRGAGGAHSAAAAMAARRQPRVLDQLFGADPPDRVVRRETTRLYRLPDRPAAGDDGSPRPQPGVDPADTGERTRGAGRRRPRHRSVRRLRHGRQLRHWHHRLRDPDDRQLRRHHQGLGAYRRGIRPLYPRCDAGQSRSLRRSDRRGGRPPAAPRAGGGKQLLRRHGRRHQVRPWRRHRQPDDHLRQHRRRHHLGSGSATSASWRQPTPIRV